VECIDQWAYSFANTLSRRSRRDPSCPLCNTSLK
jgi:hypothetical protein